MQFVVPDLQGTLQRILSMGAVMDGPIQFERAGRVLAVRNPDGHMMSLFEPTS
jgi:predicted enzyme related to lactoylglutathione lyase